MKRHAIRFLALASGAILLPGLLCQTAQAQRGLSDESVTAVLAGSFRNALGPKAMMDSYESDFGPVQAKTAEPDFYVPYPFSSLPHVSLSAYLDVPEPATATLFALTAMSFLPLRSSMRRKACSIH